jgi:hypothetical protein
VRSAHLHLGQRTIQRALQQFKAFIESRGVETGAWRGNVPAPEDR